MTKTREIIIVSVLCFVFAGLAVSSFIQKSCTWDEPYHVVRGYLPLKTGNFRFNEIHPPLIEMIAAFPLLFLPGIEAPHVTTMQEYFALGNIFLWHNGQDPEKMLYRARCMIVLLGLLLGLTVWRWSRDLWGIKGGLLSLTYFIVSPNIIAHARLATNDLGAVTFMTLALYLFWKWSKGCKRKHFVSACIVAGLALVSKFSSIVIVPWIIAIIIAASFASAKKNKCKGFSVTLGRLAAFFLIVLVVITVTYGGKFQKIPVIPEVKAKTLAHTSGLMRGFVQGVYWLTQNVALPTNQYLRGLEVVLVEYASLDPYPAFLLGKRSAQGFWYFFPVAFILKTPLATMIMLVFAFLFVRKKTGDRLWVLGFPLAFTILACASKLNIGLRHILIVYPFIFIWLGGLILIQLKYKKVFIGLLLAWYVVSVMRVYPHFLAYFNEMAGGPRNGYRCLVDSNLDWGQDLKGLKKYMRKHNIKKIPLSYFGSGEPGYYGIDYEYLPSTRQLTTLVPPPDYAFKLPQSGLVAISATHLQGIYFRNPDLYASLRRREPKAMIGYSILIYDLDSLQ